MQRRPNVDALKEWIRPVRDFPEPGIVFRDITPLLQRPAALAEAVEAMAAPFQGGGVEIVVGMEARGFILGALVAASLRAGFVPLRKPGKLPREVCRVEFDLEYARAALEMHLDALRPGQPVLIVDDVLATGGTAAASVELVTGARAIPLGATFLMELDALRGRERLTLPQVCSVLRF